MQDNTVRARSDVVEETSPGSNETMKSPPPRPPIRKWLLRLALALIFVGATFAAVLLVQPRSGPTATQTPQATQAPTRVSTPTALPTSQQTSSLPKPLIQTTPVQTKVPPQEIDVGLWYTIWGGHKVSMQVTDGVLYAATVHKKVYALRLSDGKLLWSFTVAGPVDFTPLSVESGICYVSASTYDKESDLSFSIIYALNASDGRLLWQYGENDSYLAGIENGIVFITTKNAALALRGSDGKELWRYTDAKAPFSPVVGVANGVAYIEPLSEGQSFAYGLVAVRAATGEQLWRNNGDSKNGQAYSFRMVSGKTVYVSAALSNDSQLIALNAHDGKIRWSQQIGEQGMMVEGVSGGLVFAASWDSPYHASLGTGGRIGAASAFVPDFFAQPLLPAIPYKPAKITLYVLNESDGTILWQRGITGDALGMNTRHKLINDVLYISVYIQPLPTMEEPQGGEIFALDSKTGRLIWQQRLDYSLGSMSIKDQIMYIAAYDGGIYALRLSDGVLIWHQPMKGDFYDEQMRVSDLVYVSDGNGIIYALDAGKGALRWQYQTEIPKT